MLWFLTKAGRQARRRKNHKHIHVRGYEWARHAFFIEGRTFEEINAHLYCPVDVTTHGLTFDQGAKQALDDIREMFSRHPNDNNPWFYIPMEDLGNDR